MRFFRHLLIASMVLTGIIGQVLAADFPSRVDTYINDFANLLDSETEPVVRGLLEEFQRNHNVEMTVVTVNRISDYNTDDTTIESFSTRLFNRWGIGDAATNRGIMMVVAVGDRDVRVELGSGYDSSYDREAKEVIDEHILPAFRNGNYEEGIENGVRASIHMVTGAWPSGSPISLTLGQDAMKVLAGGGLLGLGTLGVGVWMYLRNRCPECGKQSLNIQSNTLSFPTYSSTGEKEIVRDCANCGFHDVRYVTLAMLSDTSDSDSGSSSSSSSSSSDGGSSSGGGASGSW